MNQTKAEFFAFISHKSADKKVALQLQRFIETYRLPATICRSGKLSRKLGLVCSYEVDFSSNPLREEMHDKLSRSNYLVVICSESMATSDRTYINYEIRTFAQIMRQRGIDPATRIVPLVVSGDYGVCCPEALLELEDDSPIAIDLRKCKSKREAFLRLISGMLDIDYVVLENRDKKRRNRNIGLLCAAMVLLLLGCWRLWDHYVPKQYHYLDFVMKDRLPEGIHPLEKSQWSCMGGHYVITQVQGKIVSLEFVNAYGQRIDHSPNIRTGDRPSAYRFHYDSSGVSSVTYENKQGNAYFVLRYSSDTVADLLDPYDAAQAYRVIQGYESDVSALLMDPNDHSSSNITRFQYTYSPEGYVTGVQFYADSSNNLAYDTGIYGFSYTLDSKGRVVETYYLDALGERRLNSLGVYCTKFTYNAQDESTQIQYYNADGALTPGLESVTQLVKEYDHNHNLTQMYFLDAAGQPEEVAVYGAARQRQQLDDRGNLLRVELLDVRGQPNRALPYCTMAFTYDEQGRVTSRTFLDAEDTVVVDPGTQYAQVRYTYDANGNEKQVLFYDAAGALVSNAHGYAEEAKEYNEKGLVTRQTYYAADGTLAEYRDYGYCVKAITYDALGRETAICYYGKNGEPVNCTGPIYEYGYHSVETIYEEKNAKQYINFRDAQGNLVDTCSSYYGATYASVELFIQNGEITHAKYFCADGSIYSILEQKTEYTATAERIVTWRTLRNDQSLEEERVEHYRINGVPRSQTWKQYSQTGVLVKQVILEYWEDGSYSTARTIDYHPDGSVAADNTVQYD